MKRYIICIIIAASFSCLSRAQNPIEAAFHVTLNNDSVMVFGAPESNTYRFVGGRGNVWNDLRYHFEMVEVANLDVYCFVSAKTFSTAMVKFVSKENSYCVEAGIQIAREPNVMNADTVVSSERWDYIEERIDLSNVSFPCRILNQNFVSAMAQKGLTVEWIVSGLEYLGTYYIRPYVIFQDGNVMFGGEEKIDMPKTRNGFIANQADMYTLMGEDILVSNNSIDAFINQHLDTLGQVSTETRFGTIAALKQCLGKAQMETLRGRSKVEECVDGNLYVFSEPLPEDVVTHLWNYLTSDFEMQPTIDNLQTNSFWTNYNSTSLQFMSCDESLGVPYNSYLYASPTSSTRNTEFALNIDKALLPVPHEIEIVFAPSLTDDTPFLPTQARFAWYEYDSEHSSFPTSGAYQFRDETGSRNFVFGDSVRCDTVLMTYYPSKMTVKNMLQFSSYVTTSQRNTYTKHMRVAKISVRLKKEDE
ncbi:MAG: hypothetical protein II447_09695 [Bacteroidaceae bacterium]|nr:hypothetical protein [Bacteroidaceae bacterium]